MKNLIIIKGAFKGITGNYILDTGTPRMVLNARYFKGSSTTTTYSGITGEDLPVARLSGSFALGPHHWPRIYAINVNMDLLERTLQIPIHGLIGGHQFRNFTLYLDVRSGSLQLIKTQKNIPAPVINLFTDTEGIPFSSKLRTPILPLQLADGSLLYCTVDTGAEINLFSEKHRDRLSSYYREPDTQNIGGTGYRVHRVPVGLLTGVFLNGMKLQVMKTAFADFTEYNIAFPARPVDGIVGMELLQQFKVAIDFRNRRIYLEPLEVVTNINMRK